VSNVIIIIARFTIYIYIHIHQIHPASEKGNQGRGRGIQTAAGVTTNKQTSRGGSRKTYKIQNHC